ncbi:MAG: protein kinase [Bryobacteraceae bacterium]|nr:protein kinase [Bryobacteraceae bacterium]MDW8376820.1 serine/threonine-protein kinase [Bryobacterales bacterium]
MQQIGRYRVTGELGRGAMGVVYRAEDPAIGRTVAIKTIRLKDVDDPKEREFLRQRLVREARSAGVLSHPGIVTIYDVQEQDGVGYVFMEFVDGPSLEALLSQGRIGKDQLLSIIEQTAAALDYAHSKGIVHRDIKPGNLLIAPGNRVKITDFGVAKFLSHQATQSGFVLGTPSYMSPEQITDRPTDGRTDQFALAVIAYQMLTGEKPFAGSTLPSLMFKIVNEEFIPAHRLNPTLGAGVDVVLRRALHKDPHQRYPSCGDFARALANACQAKPNWEPMQSGAVETQETVAEEVPVALSRELRFPNPGQSQPVAAPSQGLKPLPRLPQSDRPPLLAEETRAEAPSKSKRRRVVLAFIAGSFSLGVLALLGRFLLFHNDQPVAPAQPAAVEQGAMESTKPSPIGPAAASVPSSVPPPPPSIIPAQESSSAPEAEPTAAASPSEAIPSPETKPVSTPAPSPAVTAPVKAVEKVKPSEKVMEEATYFVATVPPGAKIIFDGLASRSCTAPCQMTLSSGRHTLTASLEGYRLQSRIFQIPQDREILITMERALGTLTIRTTPPGATIILNGQERREKTPASFTLPTGRYHLELVKEGQRKEQYDIEIKDGVVSNIDVAWTQ